MLLALFILTSTAFVGLAGIGGIALVRSSLQRKADAQRRYYVVTFPRDLTFEQVLAFIRGLAGLISSNRLLPALSIATIVFEVEADQNGIRHRMAIPNHLAKYVIPQVRGHLSGASIVPDKREPGRWDAATELQMTSHSIPLRIGSAEGVVLTLLSSLSPLKVGEAALMQWVVAPAAPVASLTKDEAKKQADHTFSAVGRLAARAETEKEARSLTRRLFIGLSSMKDYGVTFTGRSVRARRLQDRIERRSTVIGFPCLLNAVELATVIAFPIGAPNVAGLPHGRARQLAADIRIPEKGIILANSNFDGDERPLALSPFDMVRHTHIVGPTGVGKSTALENIALQQIDQGYGVTVVDPKGDTIFNILDRIPEHRRADVILFDLTDGRYPIGFNVIASADYELVTDQIMSIFHNLYRDSWGPRMADVLRTAVLTLAQIPGMTIVDILYLLTDDHFRNQIVRKIKDPVLRDYWRTYNSWSTGERNQAIAPVLNKLRPLLLRRNIRASLGQAESGFNMSKVLRENKILLVSLPKGQLGEETSALVGSLIMAKLWQAVQGRSAIPQSARTPYFCLIDEFQDFLNLPMSMADILAQARGYQFGMVLAHQHLGQLKDIKNDVLTNARSRLIFQVRSEDARALARELSPYLEERDLQSLGAYEVVAQLSVGDAMAPPATGVTIAPTRRLGVAQTIREASRAAYGRPLAEVEAEFMQRHESLSKEPKRPSIGREVEDDGRY